VRRNAPYRPRFFSLVAGLQHLFKGGGGMFTPPQNGAVQRNRIVRRRLSTQVSCGGFLMTRLRTHGQPSEWAADVSSNRWRKGGEGVTGLTRIIVVYGRLFECSLQGPLSVAFIGGAGTPSGRFFFDVKASLAQMERELMVERTRAGLEIARQLSYPSRRGAR
jgi:hypothetical protein